jgi:hypothetical protein
MLSVKRLLFIIAIVVMVSCTLPTIDGSLGDINEWVHDNITYVSDGKFQTVQSPYQTLRRGTGDCEDYAILFMHIAHEVYGVEPDMIIVKTISGAMHGAALLDGVVYDPTGGFSCTVDKYLKYQVEEIQRTIPYWSVMFMQIVN